MAKHKRKSHKKTRRARRSSGGSCQGTPVKCSIKEGDGKVVLYCGKMRPILLKAGKGGRFVPVKRGGKGGAIPKSTRKMLIAASTTIPEAGEYQSDY